MPYLAQNQIIDLTIPGLTPLPQSNWSLSATFVKTDQLPQPNQINPWEAYLDVQACGSRLMLRTRQPGDVFAPLGLAGHRQKVNEFMINQKIPVAWRNHIPMLVTHNRILWVCGYRLDEYARVGPGVQRILHLRFEQL
jgi:tRNA(Ile)-lysidine synthase